MRGYAGGAALGSGNSGAETRLLNERREGSEHHGLPAPGFPRLELTVLEQF